ncbi:MAG TPA: HypC/HybG/HupF family hydrogenase formation chaperone [bacterium]|jgi:hydrogenase expression/formation protein HypC
MCLAIPMQVVSVDGFTARCAAKGVERDVSLFLMQEDPVAVGDYVIVHVGYAIQKVAETDALSSWELFDEILAQEPEPRSAAAGPPLSER